MPKVGDAHGNILSRCSVFYRVLVEVGEGTTMPSVLPIYFECVRPPCFPYISQSGPYAGAVAHRVQRSSLRLCSGQRNRKPRTAPHGTLHSYLAAMGRYDLLDDIEAQPCASRCRGM